MTTSRPLPWCPLRSLRTSLAAVGRRRDLFPVSEAAEGDAPGVRAWADAAAAVGLEAEAGAPDGAPPGAAKGLDAAFRDPLPGPDPGARLASTGPHPVGSVPWRLLDEAVPASADRGLVLPARDGGGVADLQALGVGEALAHEPDPRWQEAYEDGPAGAVPVRSAPATELAYARRVDVVLADRPLYGTRSLVGLLGRLHHALDDGGVLVLHDLLRDEAEADGSARNRVGRALRVDLRARGRDLVSRQDLWRLLIETGFQSVRFRPARPGRYVVCAEK